MSRAALTAGVTEAAPAKINLALHVTGRRPDGYHLLDMLVVFTQAGDRLTVEPAAEDSFTVGGPFAAQVPLSAENLVLRARDAFFARSVASCPLAVTLEKNLPVASGIGGGSSDAAAMLRALARLFPPDGALHALALPLGADVPMCLHGKPLRASGIGEALEPRPDMPALHLVLVNPGVPVATPAVFKALEGRGNPPLPALPAEASFPALLRWLTATRNDLQPPAASLEPLVGEALEALETAGAAFVRMSGSGATCFGLFPDAAGAAGAATTLRAARPCWWVVATRTTH